MNDKRSSAKRRKTMREREYFQIMADTVPEL